MSGYLSEALHHGGVLRTGRSTVLLLLWWVVVRILVMDRVGSSNFGLRHDACELFRCAFLRWEVGEGKVVTLNCPLRMLKQREGCGPNADQFSASAVSSVEKPKPSLARTILFFLSSTHSRACFIVGVRDAILPISFSSAT